MEESESQLFNGSAASSLFSTVGHDANVISPDRSPVVHRLKERHNSITTEDFYDSHPTDETSIEHLRRNNRVWAERFTALDPLFFQNLSVAQSPDYLWIGCADSRVPAK
jgi:hypothetical protein